MNWTRVKRIGEVVAIVAGLGGLFAIWLDVRKAAAEQQQSAEAQRERDALKWKETEVYSIIAAKSPQTVTFTDLKTPYQASGLVTKDANLSADDLTERELRHVLLALVDKQVVVLEGADTFRLLDKSVREPDCSKSMLEKDPLYRREYIGGQMVYFVDRHNGAHTRASLQTELYEELKDIGAKPDEISYVINMGLVRGMIVEKDGKINLGKSPPIPFPTPIPDPGPQN